jgi:L-seryl-tRNA(Ser) seleniumtransferase
MAASEPSSAPSPAAASGGGDPRRRLPPVGELLAQPAVAALVEVYGRELVLVHLRERLARLRASGERASGQRASGQRASGQRASGERASGERASGERAALDAGLAELPAQLERSLAAAAGAPLRRVVNATGIFVHTNLGRAPLPRAVASELAALLDAACDLEIELAAGRRGERNRRLERLLCLLTGAEAALVVNNNAAALLLGLACLARDREVVVSRGELVEIGGSFRIPDVLEASGARLVEVGTTNRTRLDDYRRAIGPATALLLKVHPSNYRIVGFTEAVPEQALAGLAREAGVPLLVDEGSGLLRPHPAPQLAEHPSHRELIAAGCDLVCGSGDKVLGGPQAGILVGRRELIGRCRRHPMFRALRPGRAVIAALEAVLRRHLADAAMPIDRLWPDAEEHRRRLERVARATGAQVIAADAFVGGGAAPELAIPGEALALPDRGDLLARLRQGDPPVVGYAREGRVVLDLRTVDPEDDATLVAALARALGRGPEGGAENAAGPAPDMRPAERQA